MVRPRPTQTAAAAVRILTDMGLEIVRVIGILVIQHDDAAVGKFEIDYAPGVRAVACRRRRYLIGLTYLEDAREARLPDRSSARRRYFPFIDGAVRLLHVEEPADMRVDQRKPSEYAGERNALGGVELRL